MALLGHEAILGADESASFAVVEVPEWGGGVRVKTLSSAERDAFETSLQ